MISAHESVHIADIRGVYEGQLTILAVHGKEWVWRRRLEKAQILNLIGALTGVRPDLLPGKTSKQTYVKFDRGAWVATGLETSCVPR